MGAGGAPLLTTYTTAVRLDLGEVAGLALALQVLPGVQPSVGVRHDVPSNGARSTTVTALRLLLQHSRTQLSVRTSPRRSCPERALPRNGVLLAVATSAHSLLAPVRATRFRCTRAHDATSHVRRLVPGV